MPEGRGRSADPARFQPFPLTRYELLRILGAGGFGVAFLCRHHLSKGYRLKALRVDDLGPDAAERIIREAKAMEGVQHEAIITLFDCDYADAERTRLYLAMEFFDGLTLADHVKQ